MSDLSRVEQLLRNALGDDIYEVTPQSRVEVLLQQLNELIEDIGGGSVDPEVITAWLAENIHDGAVIDSSLTVEGAAADSKKTGTEISQLKEDLSALHDNSLALDTSNTANVYCSTTIGSTISFTDSSASVTIKKVIAVKQGEIFNIKITNGATPSSVSIRNSVITDANNKVRQVIAIPTVAGETVEVRVQSSYNGWLYLCIDTAYTNVQIESGGAYFTELCSNTLTGIVDATHGYIDYTVGKPYYQRAADTTKSTSERCGIKRDRYLVTVDYDGGFNKDFVIKLSGPAVYSQTATSVAEWANGITLKEGHTYKLDMRWLNNDVVANKIYPIVYPAGSASGVGTARFEGNGYTRTFTAENTTYHIAMYVYKTAVLQNAQFMLTLEEIDLLPNEYDLDIPVTAGLEWYVDNGIGKSRTGKPARASSNLIAIPDKYNYMIAEAYVGYAVNVIEFTPETKAGRYASYWNGGSKLVAIDHSKRYAFTGAMRNTDSTVTLPENGCIAKLHLYRDMPNQWLNPVGECKKYPQLDPICIWSTNNTQMQGCATNGTKILSCSQQQHKWYLIDIKTGAVTSVSTEELGHCNDATYYNGYYYVASMLTTGEVYKVDPETLEIVDTIIFKDENDTATTVWRLEYDKTTDRFYSAHGTEAYLIYDTSFAVVGSLTKSGSATIDGNVETYRQGMCVDNKYLYEFNESHDFLHAFILVYDKTTGEYVSTINVELVTGFDNGELEGGAYDWEHDVMYISFIDRSSNGKKPSFYRMNIKSTPDISKWCKYAIDVLA